MWKTLIVFALFLAGCAGRDADPGPDYMSQQEAYEQLAGPIMLLVADEMDKPSAKVPTVEFRQLNGDVHAIYHSERDVIVLPADWIANDAGVAAMAHEFAHAVQAKADPERAQRRLDVIRDIRAGRTENAWARMDQVWRECLEDEAEAFAIHRWYLQFANSEVKYPDAWIADFAQESCRKHLTARDRFTQEG